MKHDLRSFPSHPLLARYAGDLAKALEGQLTEEEQDDLIDETLFVLERMVDERMLCGKGLDEAARAATREAGSPAALAARHIEGFFELQTRHSPMIRFLGHANALAFGVFGCATLFNLILIQIRIYQPTDTAIRFPFTPAEVRSIFPEPLPFPELSWSFVLGMIFPLVTPFFLAPIVGREIPVRAGAAVYRALVPCVFGAFLAGLVLLPNTDGLLFAATVLLYWIPVGCFIAHRSSLSARRKRARQMKGAAATAPGLRNL